MSLIVHMVPAGARPLPPRLSADDLASLNISIAPQEPIRSAMPEVHPDINWTLIIALTLNFATVIGIGFVAWRFFRG